MDCFPIGTKMVTWKNQVIIIMENSQESGCIGMRMGKNI